MYWFTGDQHFNHSNIITKFVFRPFKDVEEMNLCIIQRHNERVKPSDTVYHLGDFKHTANGPSTRELISMLNGNHVFISGNHDRRNGLNAPLKYAVVETYGHRILLCHRPDDAATIAADLAVNLCFVAHVHDKWKFRGNMINVGVDQWNFYPVGAKQILKAYNHWRRDESGGA